LIVTAGLSRAYVVVVRPDGPLLYPNANAVENHVLTLAAGTRAVVLDLEATTELDVQGADMLLELAEELGRSAVEFRIANAQPPAHEVMRRAGVTDQVAVDLARRPSGGAR
jgi:sulfate permease, SulP family